MASSTHQDLINKINSNEDLINKKISNLESVLKTAKDGKVASFVASEKVRLTAENQQLRKEIEALVHKLNQLEGRPANAPSAPIFVQEKQMNDVVKKETSAATQATPPKVETPKQAQEQKPKEQKKESKKEAKLVSGGSTASPAGGDRPVDVSRLDFRVGRIVTAKKHPDADGLYVEEVDLGEGKNRTVVSGLVKFVPLEEMQNRLALLLCNLKPAKMRGITSEAMVMCASTPEKVEILVPPTGAQPGDRVVCDGYPGEPDDQLNPKKKIFEQVAPDLKTNGDGVFVYKGVPLTIPRKGNFKAPTLKNVQVK